MSNVQPTPFDEALLLETFNALTEELRQQNICWQEPSRLLIVFAQTAKTDNEEKIQLHVRARLSPDMLRDLDEASTRKAIERLHRYLYHPRWAKDARVDYHANIPTADPVDMILFDRLKREAGSRPDSLRTIIETGVPDSFSAQGLLKQYRVRRHQVWGQWKDRIVGSQRLKPEQVPDSERNDLDDLMWEFPDLVVLTLPVLGSPVVTCALAATEPAYQNAGEIIPDLYVKHLRVLRDILVPFFFARFALLADRYISQEEASGVGPPEEPAARFLLDAGRLLLAKSVRVPYRDGEYRLSAEKALEDYGPGIELIVPLPKSWEGGDEAIIQLPAYNVIDPERVASWRAPEHAERIPSSSLKGTPAQHHAIKAMLSSLVHLVHHTAGARSERARTFEGVGHALRSVTELTAWDKIHRRLVSAKRRLSELSNPEIVDIMDKATASLALFSLAQGLGNLVRVAGAISRGHFGKLDGWHDPVEFSRWDASRSNQGARSSIATTYAETIFAIAKMVCWGADWEALAVTCPDAVGVARSLNWSAPAPAFGPNGFRPDELRVLPFRRGADVIYVLIIAIGEPILNAARAMTKERIPRDTPITLRVTFDLPKEVRIEVGNPTKSVESVTARLPPGVADTAELLRQTRLGFYDDPYEDRTAKGWVWVPVRFQPYALARRLHGRHLR